MHKALEKLSLVSLAAILAAGLLTGTAHAESKKLLGTHRDWDAFTLTTDEGQKICYVVSLPKDTAPKGVNRGQTYITVTHSPARKAFDEVNVIAGYTYKSNSEVTFNVDGTRKKLFTEGDAAWAYDADSDKAVVKAMKAGVNLTVTGVSSRGTTTVDKYSLLGFSDAYAAASKACGR
jgi:hypothetical protein